MGYTGRKYGKQRRRISAYDDEDAGNFLIAIKASS